MSEADQTPTQLSKGKWAAHFVMETIFLASWRLFLLACFQDTATASNCNFKYFFDIVAVPMQGPW